MNDDQRPDRHALLRRMAALCLERRAEDPVALDVSGLVDYMDALLVVTARSDRQARAIAENVIRALKKEGLQPLSRAGIDFGSWICVDFVDVVLHVFLPETRAFYDLELLWADAERVEIPEKATASESRPG